MYLRFYVYIIDVSNKCVKLHSVFHFYGVNAGIRFTRKISIY